MSETREPAREATREPARDATREPARDATREPARDATREPARDATRELILARVRAAIAGAEPSLPAPRTYRTQGTLEPAARTELLCERIRDYRAQVRRTGADELGAAIAEAFASAGAARVCVPSGVPPQWRAGGLEFVADAALDHDSLDQIDGVLTGCTVAIAETGTIVLSGGASEGRRALSLIPDLHVCVVEEAQVVETVPEAMALLAELVRTERRPITFISGPSATSDIELNRIEGVHGPRRLIVLVVSEETA
jgi:L-lactate dehydrogenase complex protein LldG